ncbi:MAG TPA: hypothetical protein VK891_03890, partial [Euzebyales bacterium]|nr:hypothetical protein [Euzebyales bacterium]
MSEVEWGSFDPQGPASAAMAELWWWMLGLGTAVFVAFAVLLAIGLFRRRGTGTGTAGDDPDAAGDDPDAADDDTGAPSSDTLRRWLVVAGVVLPAIIILVVFAATIRAMRWVPTGAPAGAMVREVTGHRVHRDLHLERGLQPLEVGPALALEVSGEIRVHAGHDLAALAGRRLGRGPGLQGPVDLGRERLVGLHHAGAAARRAMLGQQRAQVLADPLAR